MTEEQGTARERLTRMLYDDWDDGDGIFSNLDLCVLKILNALPLVLEAAKEAGLVIEFGDSVRAWRLLSDPEEQT